MYSILYLWKGGYDLALLFRKMIYWMQEIPIGYYSKQGEI